MMSAARIARQRVRHEHAKRRKAKRARALQGLLANLRAWYRWGGRTRRKGLTR